MLAYVLRRIALAIPTLLLISLATFGLSKCAPFDGVRDRMGEQLNAGLDPLAMSASYAKKARQLELDIPSFYCSVHSRMFPDTLYRVYPPERRSRLEELTVRSGDWATANQLDADLSTLAKAIENLPDTLDAKSDLRGYLRDLLLSYDPAENTGVLEKANTFGVLTPALTQIRESNQKLLDKKASFSDFFPAIHWHGLANQYHQWITGFFTGDLGVNRDGRLVWDELRPRMYSTLTINGMAILISILLAIPLGVYMSHFRGKWLDSWGQSILLFLHSIPSFWLGSLLILFLATPGHGLYLIKSTYAGLWDPTYQTFPRYVLSNFSKFILPVITLSVHLLAVLALQMRGGMLNVLSEDYIRTARAKGLPESVVLWRHGLPNGFFPMITLLAGLLPLIFTGSLVIEYLFQFPGLGTLTQASFATRDYPVLFAILMIASMLTVLGNLLADLLYAWLDPRVRYTHKQ
jgi:peptide/nickel transport system permease protein